MCGISGFWQPHSSISEAGLCQIVAHMANALQHRGPDDSGIWIDATEGLALGHRRLAIVDLSPTGHQPMPSATGRYVITFNGEIYNHLELRAVLGSAAPTWRGHSDTETLLACFEVWGVERTLAACIGMFAIALWDRVESRLTLMRDRFGEKPLYYGWIGQGTDRAFAFGSELKALQAYPGFNAPVCRKALAQYLRFMYVPAPLSIFEGIYKLEPGCLLSVSVSPENTEIKRWWSLASVVKACQQNPLLDEGEALSLLETQLLDSVRLQSQADVPLGAFLSGGVDSSTIVALMQRNAREQGGAPVKTFTVGSDISDYDESTYAQEVARHLGTDHAELFVSSNQALDVILHLPEIFDEPFADSSQIPTHLVSKAARQKVMVALSGDAGDELFGGYNRYLWGPRIWRRLSWLPFSVRRILAAGIHGMPLAGWDALNKFEGVPLLADKARKLAQGLNSARNADELYWTLRSEWADPADIVRGGQVSTLTDLNPDINVPAELNSVERMMFFDSLTYLPDDILCKVDRAAMSCSLETRVPFLDHRVVEIAWRLQISMRIRGNQGKWILRQMLDKYVPRELIDRPKTGFGIPLGQWLCGPLRDWAENLLDETRLTAEGYFYVQPIRVCWAEHLSGRRDHTAKLWAVLMFQAWLEKNQ